MIGIGAPGFLWAGVAFALLPVALHFLTRRPPERQPLPTARFLRPDPRTLLRFQRLPADRALLLLRVLFAVLLGAAFADVTWARRPTGDARIVLLDAGAGWGTAWPAAREAARGAAGPSGVLVYGTGEPPAILAPDGLEAARPGDVPATAEDGLRALRRTAEDMRWTRTEVVWVTPATWDRWTPGFAFLRPVLWPGAVELVDVLPASVGRRAAAPLHAVVDEQPGADRLRRAVVALGGSVVDAESDTAGRVVRFSTAWTEPFARDAGGDPRAADAVVVVPAAPTTLQTGGGVRVLAVSEDARPLATTEDTGNGCLIRVGAPWPRIADARGPALPDFVDTLVRGCGPHGAGVRLDTAARDVLRRADLPARVDASALGTAGTPLTRWIFGLLLLLLAIEVLATRRRTPRAELSRARTVRESGA